MMEEILELFRNASFLELAINTLKLTAAIAFAYFAIFISKFLSPGFKSEMKKLGKIAGASFVIVAILFTMLHFT